MEADEVSMHGLKGAGRVGLGKGDEGSSKDAQSVWMVSCRPVGCLNKFSELGPLMFRPSSELICPNGLKCKILRTDAQHASLYKHMSKEEHHRMILEEEGKPTSAWWLRGLPSSDNSSISSPPATSTSTPTSTTASATTAANPAREEEAIAVHVLGLAIPHVRDCYMLDEAAAHRYPVPTPPPPPKNTSTLALPPHDTTIFLHVHGFRQGYYRVHGILDHLRKIVASDPADMSSCACAFLWPAHKKKLAYALAGADSHRAAKHLRASIACLRARRNRIVVIAHSMGARVALKALYDAPAAVNVDHLVLLASAVQHNVLQQGKEFARDKVQATRITSFHSRNDPTLANHFRGGEFSRGTLFPKHALGLLGPGAAGQANQTRSQTGPRPVEVVDVSESVKHHSPHAWLCCQAVTEHLLQLRSETVS